jgi:hypothetical protein
MWRERSGAVVVGTPTLPVVLMVTSNGLGVQWDGILLQRRCHGELSFLVVPSEVKEEENLAAEEVVVYIVGWGRVIRS